MKLNLLFILIVLVLVGAQAKKARKWRPPLEFGPKTTGIYSSLQRSNRRKINVNLLDPYDDRTKPPRAKLSGTSYKPGTWNWYPNMDIPGYSYRFKIFNLTKDEAGSYMGMHDYRKNYGPLYNTRFGGTYPPIPPLLGDARQPRLAWFLKKYSAPAPPANYIDHIMETIKDGQIRQKEFEKQLDAKNAKKVSAEWYTVRPKNESNYFYEEEKIKPRFGDYGGIALEDAFPAYKPKKPYEVVMLPDQPVYKRSAESSSDVEKEAIEEENPTENLGPKKKSVPKKSESYSSNSYTYEQFNSNESIPVPFSPEQQISASSSGDESSEELLSHTTESLRHKREVGSSENDVEYTSGQKFSDYSEVTDLYSKSESFPAPLNTGESGWGAKPPASKSTEGGSDGSSDISKLKFSESSSKSKKSKKRIAKKKKSKKGKGESDRKVKPPANNSTESDSDYSSDISKLKISDNFSERKKSKKHTAKKKKTKKSKTTDIPKNSGYPDHPYPRMKPEDDSEVPRDSSGLDNESFPSLVGSHSSEMLIWDAMRNFSAEFKPISSSSSLEHLQIKKYLQKENKREMDSRKNKVKPGDVDERKRSKRALKWKPPSTTTPVPKSSEYYSWGSTEERLLNEPDSFPEFEDLWPKSLENNSTKRKVTKKPRLKNQTYPKKRGKYKVQKGKKGKKGIKIKPKHMEWKREIRYSDEFAFNTNTSTNDSSSTYLSTEEVESTSSVHYIPSFDSFAKSTSEEDVSDPSSYSSGDLSQFNSESSPQSSGSLHSKVDSKAEKSEDEKGERKKAKTKSVKGKTNKRRGKVMGLPPKHPSRELKMDISSDYDLSNPWGDLSFVDEVTVGPDHLRTFGPTFTEQYVAPLHHQPDEFWDEIYKPDGPDPTLAPYQIEEEERRKATTTWKPPIITTRDPTSKPRFIYVTNEDSNDDDDIILTSSQQSAKEFKKQHSRGLHLTKTQLQLKQILKLKNKAKSLQEGKNGKGVMEAAKGKDKGKKEKKKPKQKDKQKKENPNNFSRPRPDLIGVQGHSGTQSAVAIGDPVHNAQKENVIRDSINKIQKGNKKIQEPAHHLNDPQLYLAVTPFEPDYSFSESRPEGNYEWPSLIHPKLDPKTAYDDEGYPIHESPGWTSPSTHKKDRIFGRDRNVPSGVRGRGISMQQYMKEMNIHPYNEAAHPDISHPAVSSKVNTGPHMTGSDMKETHVTGLDKKGPRMSGHDMKGPHVSAADITGPQISAPHLSGLDVKGPHKTGLDVKGPHKTGLDVKGPHKTGLDVKGSHVSGVDQKKPLIVELDMKGPHMLSSHIMGPRVPTPGMPGPHMSGLHMPGPHLTESDMKGPHMPGAHMAGSDMKGPHMPSDKSAPHMVGSDGVHAMNLQHAQHQPAVAQARWKREAVTSSSIGRPREQKRFSDNMELKPPPKNWPVPTYPKGGYKLNQKTVLRAYPSSYGSPKNVPDKLKNVDLTHQAVNHFQVHNVENLHPLLQGNQNLKNVNQAGDAEHNLDAVNFHAGMKNINMGRVRAKRSVENKKSLNSRLFVNKEPKKKDEGLNPLLYGNQNLFSVNNKLTQQKNKRDEGLNPLLYGNQNLFSANHQNYIKLSDIHSPFAKPPYGIPIDSEIKVYNDGHEAPSPVFTGNLNEQLTRKRIYLEKMNLLKILQEKRKRLQTATNLRAAARLAAPDPQRHNPDFNKQGMNTVPHPGREHGIDARHVVDYDHVINKRSAWDQERLHPMLYGQHGIFKPKHRRPNPPIVNKEIQWMPYIDMEAARIFTSNPKVARKRLREYNKLIGRDTEKLREALRLRNEKRRQQEQNPLMIPNKNHNRDYRRALLRHGIVPGKDHVFAEKNTEIPIKINPNDETEDRAWMPYVNMNKVMAKAMKKTQGEHRIQKRNIDDQPDKKDAQQPFAVTSGYRPKRTTKDESDESKPKKKQNTRTKKSKSDSKAKTSVEDMFASYFDHIPQQIITRRPTSTTPAPFTHDSSFEEYKDEIEDVTAYHGFMYWTRPPSRPPRTHKRYTKPTPVEGAPQWMVDKARNIYNPRLPSKEMYERIEARVRKEKTRRNRRFNRYGRTFSDKHVSFYDNFYYSSTQATQKPTQPKNARRTYIPNVTVGSVPKDDLFYEKLFDPVTRIVGATRRTFIPNIKIANYIDKQWSLKIVWSNPKKLICLYKWRLNMLRYTTPENYLDNYEIPVTKPLQNRHSDETKFSEPEVTKKPYHSQETPRTYKNHISATMVPFNANPNAKRNDQWYTRYWPTRRPRRGRRTYMTRGPNATYPTMRNFESPVMWPDGHIEPPYDISMTKKTFPPEYYDKINASFYDDYYNAAPKGWVDSEYRRWHGQRAEGLKLESVDDDYYSEYANWYLKKRDNSTEERMFEVYDSNSPRPSRPTRKTRTQRRKKKFRDVSEVSGFSEYERGMRKRFDQMLKDMLNHVPVTDKTVIKEMKGYMKDLEKDPMHKELMKSEPFKDLFPPESYFKTNTAEACDTSSMQRYFMEGVPAYPEKEKAYKHRMARFMRLRKKHKMEMERYRKQMEEMESKIDQLAKKKTQSRGLLRNLYGKNSLLRKLKVKFFSNPQNRNITRNIKDKVKSFFSFGFKNKRTTTVKPTVRIF